MRSTRIWQGVVAAAVVAVALVVPVRTAFGAPVVRLAEVPVPALPTAAPGGDGVSALSGGASTASSRVTFPHPSSHLGLRWVGDEDAAIELRWRGAHPSWSPWTSIEVSHDLGDEDRGIRLSGLARADDAIEAEVRLTAPADVRGVEVVAIDTEHGPRPVVPVRDAALASHNADARVGQPDVVSRAEWGADESLRSGTPGYGAISKMSVHHTVTPNNDPDPTSTVRAIYAYHTQSNGWNDIGYNFLVDHKGRIYEGRYARAYGAGEEPTGEDERGYGVIGAHTGGSNTGTVGIALLGTYSSAKPTDAAVNSLTRFLAWEADRHSIDPTGTTTWNDGSTKPTIAGHRDAKATDCPGGALYDMLPAIRRSTAQIVAAANAVDNNTGYWELGRDGRVYAFGEASSALATASAVVPAPVVSMAPTPTGEGFWILSSNGRVTPFGDAAFHGSTQDWKLNAPVVRLEPTSSGKGYWVLGADGGVFSFGDAAFHGSTGNLKLNAPVISMAATPTGKGYWLLAKDGGVFTFGDGVFHGSTGGMRLNAPVVSMAPHPSGNGYWLQAADGGIFSFGTRFHGSVPGLKLGDTAPSVQIRATPSGGGYYVQGSDGGVFTFGDARFFGAQPGLSGSTAAVDLALHFNRTKSAEEESGDDVVALPPTPSP